MARLFVFLRIIAWCFVVGTMGFLGAQTYTSIANEPEFKSPWGILEAGDPMPPEVRP